jgi:hypothetical protein
MEFHTIAMIIGFFTLVGSWTIPKLIKDNERVHAYISGTLNGFGLACFILATIFQFFY